MTSRNSKCCIIPHVSGERQTVGHSRVMVSVGHSRVMVSVGHSRVMVSVGHSRVMVSRKGYPFPPLPPPGLPAPVFAAIMFTKTYFD